MKQHRLWSDYQVALKSGEGSTSLTLARAIAGNGFDFQTENWLTDTSDDLEALCDTLEPIKVALLSSGTLDHFVPILRFRLMLAGYRPEIFTPNFDTVSQNIRNVDSDLYSFDTDVVWMMNTFRDIVGEIDSAVSQKSISARVDTVLADISLLSQKSNALVIVNNLDEAPELGLGNFEAVAASGRVGIIRKFNQDLTRFLPDGVICDV